MNLKNEAKVGFDRLNLISNKTKEELRNESKKYRNNIIDSYIKIKLLLIEPQYIQKLCNIKEKYKNVNNPIRQSNKSKAFINVKQKIIQYLIDKRKNEIIKKYNKFDDSLVKKKNNDYKFKDIFRGVYNGLVSTITFNIIDLRIKENKSDLLEKLINGEEDTKYLKELDAFKSYEKNCIVNILKDEVHLLIQASTDQDIFNYLKKEKQNSLIKLKTLKIELKNDMKENEINLNKT